MKLASRILPNFCRLCVGKLNITLKPLNRVLYAAYHLKEETLGFLSMYKNYTSMENIILMENNDFISHFWGIEGNFTRIDCRACPHGA